MHLNRLSASISDNLERVVAMLPFCLCNDVESCHGINNWGQVDFNHDFPLQGPHNKPCADCHTAGTTATFSCLGACHEHTVTKMADKHSGVNGYIYDFPACLACHPDGDD